LCIGGFGGMEYSVQDRNGWAEQYDGIRPLTRHNSLDMCAESGEHGCNIFGSSDQLS
jgi:hypothetical protein